MVFTEHGAIMAASVLNSDRTVEMSGYVVRAFVQLRELLTSHKALAEVINAIRALMVQPKPANRPIGFTTDLIDRPRE